MDHLPGKNAHIHGNMHTISGVNWAHVTPGGLYVGPWISG